MNKITIAVSATIKNALEKLDKEQVGTLVVIDKENKYLGTLSNGDLRRAILRTKNINQKIVNYFNKNSTFMFKENFSHEKASAIILKKKYDFIPILTKKMKLNKIYRHKEAKRSKTTRKDKNEIKGVPVVIMAGGLGTRLEPFTSILPKPLIPINEKPIIRHIIESFKHGGIKNYFITLNYKSILLKSYFKEIKLKEKIQFIEEKKPLGTIGAIKLIEHKLPKNFFLTNCDTIIKANYEEIYKFHKKNLYDITIVASLKKYVIPYGVCEINKDYSLEKLNEKPFYDLLVNTGLYCINKEIIKRIPKNKKYDVNTFISALKKDQKKIGIYPISGKSWIDIGQWSEYKNALQLLNY